MTRISVALATFNGAAFVGEQIQSIIDQSRQPDELVICDDRSTDSTLEIVEHLARNSPFPFRVTQNSETLGSTRNFDQAVRHCSGDIVALSDQDDVWHPEKLASVEKAFSSNPALGLIFSDADVVDERLNPLGYSLLEGRRFGRRCQSELRAGKADDRLLAHSFVTGAAMAFRRDFATLILPFPTELPHYIHDRWTAILIAAVSRIDVIDAKLIRYRQHGRQQIGSRRETIAGRAHDRFQKRLAVLAEDREALAAIRRRLNDHPECSPRRDFIEALERRERHLDARLRLPQSRVARLPLVVRELASSRYHRCSSGILSAVKDLIL